MIREAQKQMTVLGKTITARVTHTDCGIQLLLAGGDRSHIGAVAVADEAGKVTVQTFPGHRETEIAQRYAEAFYERYRVPVVASVGIHYDNITKQQITEIVAAAETVLEELLQ